MGSILCQSVLMETERLPVLRGATWAAEAGSTVVRQQHNNNNSSSSSSRKRERERERERRGWGGAVNENGANNAPLHFILKKRTSRIFTVALEHYLI